MDSQNRIWWVIGSVSLLAIVVLVGGLYWLRPSGNFDLVNSQLPLQKEQSFDPFEYVRNDQQNIGFIENERDETRFLGMRDSDVTMEENQLTIDFSGVTNQSDLISSYTTSINDTAVSEEVVIQESQLPRTDFIKDISKPMNGSELFIPPVVPYQLPKELKIVNLLEPHPIEQVQENNYANRNEFWIQIGSFTNRNRAESLKTLLSQKGLQVQITTRKSNRNVYFRVRMGPYYSELEADKFLSWINKMDGLHKSYVSQINK